MLERGIPGEANTIVLDNGHPPLPYAYQRGKSRRYEINPVTYDIPWTYEN
jgi:hypothetical protein